MLCLHFSSKLLLLWHWAVVSSAVSLSSTASEDDQQSVIIHRLTQSGESVVLSSPLFPDPYKMSAKPARWQIRWALQSPAHLQILFSDLRLHPSSRLELYDGDLPAFRLTETARLLVRYESGADYWRRVALTADSGVLTVVFTPLVSTDGDAATDSRIQDQPAAHRLDNVDYDGFRLEIRLLHYASSAWLERPWSNCGWLPYTADSVSLLGTNWRHYDCVWVLRPPAGTRAWVRLRSKERVKDAYQYDMEIHEGGTSADLLLGRVTSLLPRQPELSFTSAKPLYVRIRGNFSDSANHLVLQYHFYSAAADTAANCRSAVHPGFEFCPQLRLCIIPVCHQLPELSACGSELNCSRGPSALRSCLLRLDSQQGSGLQPRTLCRDGLRCVPLSVACPTSLDGRRISPRQSRPSQQPPTSSLSPSTAAKSASLNLLASFGAISLAVVALAALAFATLTLLRRRSQHLHPHRRNDRRPGQSTSAAHSLMRVVRLDTTRSSQRLQSTSPPPPPPPPPSTPPPAYSDVVRATRRSRGGSADARLTPKPASAAGVGANAGCGSSGNQQQHQRQRRHRRRRNEQINSQFRHQNNEVQQQQQQPLSPRERQSQIEQPDSVCLPPLHGSC